MTRRAVTITMATLLWTASACARGEEPATISTAEVHMVTLDDVRRVSPALESYSQGAVNGDLWKRPGLTTRDRSIVTVAALIARNQAVELSPHFTRALDNGVTPGQLSEIITHLAFYSGWANATAAVAVAKGVFDQRHIAADQLPAADGPRLPIDEAAEAQRAEGVAENVGPVAPGLEQYTTEYCSAISGCLRASRLEIAVSSRSAH
jgi:4-carboxymuconolactone decarboxylase